MLEWYVCIYVSGVFLWWSLQIQHASSWLDDRTEQKSIFMFPCEKPKNRSSVASAFTKVCWGETTRLRRFKWCCRKELWDGITSFPLVKDGPGFPTLKEVRKEAVKHLSSACRDSTSSHHGCRCWNTAGSLPSVRNAASWCWHPAVGSFYNHKLLMWGSPPGVIIISWYTDSELTAEVIKKDILWSQLLLCEGLLTFFIRFRLIYF